MCVNYDLGTSRFQIWESFHKFLSLAQKSLISAQAYGWCGYPGTRPEISYPTLVHKYLYIHRPSSVTQNWTWGLHMKLCKQGMFTRNAKKQLCSIIILILIHIHNSKSLWWGNSFFQGYTTWQPLHNTDFKWVGIKVHIYKNVTRCGPKWQYFGSWVHFFFSK